MSVMEAIFVTHRCSFLPPRRDISSAAVTSIHCPPSSALTLGLRNTAVHSIGAESGYRMRGGSFACSAGVDDITDSEKEGWATRQKEAGVDPASPGGWEWTLNWDAVTPSVLIGSCPRSASDIGRIADEAGATAVLNLQSDICFEALRIPFPSILAGAVDRGLLLQHVPIRDFDRGDQTLMLPEAVRCLHSLVARGHRVYVHCTAGINRASLTVLGYLTFVQGMSLEEAQSVIKSARSQAHPYVECWTEVRRKLLDGRGEELTVVAEEIYRTRLAEKRGGDAASDWANAQTTAISRTFSRWLEVDLGSLAMQQELLERSAARQVASLEEEIAELKRGSLAQNGVASLAGDDLECDVITRACATPVEAAAASA